MRNKLKIILYIIAGGGIILTVFLCSILNHLQYPVYKPPIVQNFVWLKNNGGSMTDYGIPGDADTTIMLKLYIHQICNIGDNCAFRCYTQKCLDSDKLDHANVDHISEIKHLVDKNDNCYWFEGNKNPWVENGIRYQSDDSRDFGWLCGNDLKIDGVVRVQ